MGWSSSIRRGVPKGPRRFPTLSNFGMGERAKKNELTGSKRFQTLWRGFRRLFGGEIRKKNGKYVFATTDPSIKEC